MRAPHTLLTVLAVASLTTVACGDDTKPSSDTSGGDTNTTDTSGGDTNTNGDTGTNGDTNTSGDTGGPDASNPCGTRECGTFAGVNCGSCTAPEACNAAGRCEAPGAPLGSYCGYTTTCNADSPDFPDCFDDQCASKNCLVTNPSALVFRNVCTNGCQIYKDSDNNGVNDVDAELDDCSPDDAVNGPAGDVFRCVNFAPPGQNPVGVCVPGSEFADCRSNNDCPTGESCEITTIGGDVSLRCVANYRETDAWEGNTVGLSESCNEDPASGEVNFCEGGLCFGFGCVALCDSTATDGGQSGCDTTKVRPGTGCIEGKCGGNPNKSCTTDVDCSAFQCEAGVQIFSNAPQLLFDLCFPNNCQTDVDCGGGFYCRFFWNGEPGADAGLDSLCLAQNPDGADLGEACIDPSETVPGETCKNEDLCIGGYCSTLCKSNSDCNESVGQLCATAELPGDFDEDGETDFVLPVNWCQTYPGYTTDCLSNADCQATEVCQVFEVANYNGDTLNADGPYTLAGVCTAYDTAAFPGEAGKFGDSCETGADCRSGFCYPLDDAGTVRICTEPCQATSECAKGIDIGGETANGICVGLLYGWGGELADVSNDIYLGLCLPDLSSLNNCSDDFTCEGSEACFPNVIAAGPTTPAKVEYLCFQVWETAEARGTKVLGAACDPNAEVEECASGLCVQELDSDAGYCAELCDVGSDACGNGTTCQNTTRIARVGQYEGNSGSYGLCLKDQDCSPCGGQWDCPGDLACVNLGTTSAADFRCVPSCNDGADCAGETATTCNEGVDATGRTAKGCFAKNAGNVPVNYCGN